MTTSLQDGTMVDKIAQFDLPTGTLFTLGHSIRHDVEAKSDTVFLLTISWPSAEELAAMKHRGYGS